MMKWPKVLKFRKTKSSKKVKPVKKRKPVKKNTWYRKYRAWDLRTDRRQQQRPAVALHADDTVRTCSNCGEVYKGRLCPQCGQAGSWTRYTWKQAMLNFLDIWGLGNRPMFRTVKELFWRPGYMIRDYFNGHRNCYFPPFKLLAVMVVLLLITSKLTGVEQYSYSLVKQLAQLDMNDLTDGENAVASGYMTQYMQSVCEAFLMCCKFLASSMVSLWLVIAAFMGISIWIVFRHVSRYTFIETYVFYIFILSQDLICSMFRAIGRGIYGSIEKQALLWTASGDASVGGVFWTVILFIAAIVGICFSLAVFYLMVLDFRQFYGLKWKTTIKYLLKVAVMLVLLVVWTVSLLGTILFIEKTNYMWLALLILLLLPVSYVVADKYMTRNMAVVPNAVLRISKLSMLSVLVIIVMGFYMYEKEVNLVKAWSQVIIYDVAAVAVSLLPILLYKKYHRIWVACLPLLLTLLLVYLNILILAH